MAARENWQDFEGRALDRGIVPGKCLAASDHSAIFEIRYGEPRPKKSALKLISVDPATAARQLARVEGAARLSHPGLIQIFRSGLWPVERPRVLYVVMEYAAENLAEVVSQRALTPAEMQEALGTTLDVLAYLHLHGCAHGHLTPSNILAINDQVKISSDGLTRIGDAPSAPSKDLYHPPEAWRESVTPAWDVWALGVILVQALTLQPPAWERSEPRKLLVPAALPEPFREIARNCLQDDPHRRWTVERIQARLASGTSSPADPLPAARAAAPGVDWTARRYVMPAAGTGVVAALLVVLGLTHRRPSAPDPSSVSQSAPKRPVEKGRPSPFGGSATSKERAGGGTSTEARAGTPRAAVTTSPEAQGPPPPPPAPAQPEAQNPPGVILRRVMPNVPAKARNTIQGTVRVGVAVEVDAKGNVKHARLESPGTSRYFAKLALGAARGWKFSPAPSNGADPLRAWILRFEFRRSGTEVQPAPSRGGAR